MTEFFLLKSINPGCGLQLKQPILVTMKRTEDNLNWVASAQCFTSGLVGPDQGQVFNVLLATIVSRFYALSLRRDMLAPDLYDEWVLLNKFIGYPWKARA